MIANFYVSFIKCFFLLACSVLLAGDDAGSVWLYDMESCLLEAKTKDKHDLKQTQVNLKHVRLRRILHRFQNDLQNLFSV